MDVEIWYGGTWMWEDVDVETWMWRDMAMWGSAGQDKESPWDRDGGGCWAAGPHLREGAKAPGIPQAMCAGHGVSCGHWRLGVAPKSYKQTSLWSQVQLCQ